MKTFKLNLYAVPVALLLMASGLASQTASAETTGHYKTIVARFSYDAAEPAERIYADLKRTAERLCADQGPRPISLRSYERQCTSDLVQAAVDAIARVDVAAVHTRVLNS